MDHLHEVTGAVRAAVVVALFGGRGLPRPALRSGRCINAGRDRSEDRIEPLDGLLLASDHQAEAPFKAKHAAARTDVHVMDSLLA